MEISSEELWIIASTVLFVALVWRPAAKALGTSLGRRGETIAHELQEAQKLRQEAAALLADAESRHANAVKDAEAILQAAQDEAGRLRTAGESELKTQLARREQQALDRIAQAEAAAVNEVRTHAVDLALAASRDLLGQRLVGAEGEKLVDQLASDLPPKFSATAT
jgi:F-type H+-transporting ATPase subunit b